MKFVAILFVFFVGTSRAQENNTSHYIDSLKNVIAKSNSDHQRVKAYFLWDIEIYMEDPHLDEEINLKMVEICNKNLADHSLPFTELEYFYRTKSACINNLGLVACDYGDFLKAHTYFQQSLDMSLSTYDSLTISNAYNNLGMISQKLLSEQKAIDYYNLGIKYDTESEDGLAIYYNNLGVCYDNLGQDSAALAFYRKSIALSSAIDSRWNQANSLGNMAEIFQSIGQLDSALIYYKAALKIDHEINSAFNIPLHKAKLGQTYTAMNQPELGLRECQESVALLEQNYSLITESACHECLYQTYKKLNLHKEALLEYEQFMVTKEALFGSEKTSELMAVQLRNEFQKKSLTDSISMTKNQAIRELGLTKNIEQKEIQQKFLFLGLGLVAIFGLFFYRNFRLKKRDNQLITHQKNDLEAQKNLVDLKNKEIVDSINYARRLQSAILPDHSTFNRLIPHSFVLYLPKDIVAGDFYWIEETENTVYFACADCTGHGVPGAMLSVVCHNALNRALKEFKCTTPADILNQTRTLVIETFDSTHENVKDGMDIALCAFNRSTQVLEFAGAYNSLYHFRDNEVTKLTGDKQPIGHYFNPTPFKNQLLELRKNDQLFLFTDGIVDQFGGEKGKKMKYKPFIQFLSRITELSPAQQKSAVHEHFNDWKGNFDQLDDLCVIGVKIGD